MTTPDREPYHCDVNTRSNWMDTELKDKNFEDWLRNDIFPMIDLGLHGYSLNTKAFEASQSLYYFDLYRSLLVQALHYGFPAAGFSEAQLSLAILEACKESGLPIDAWWFHVNIHDNSYRVVERYGRYNYAYPLAPIYTLLEHHQAIEGGATYAGLASPDGTWLLLFDSGTSISVHGPQAFVDAVVRQVPRAQGLAEDTPSYAPGTPTTDI